MKNVEWHYLINDIPDKYTECILAIFNSETGERWTSNGYWDAIKSKWVISTHKGKYSANKVYAWAELPEAPIMEDLIK